MTPSKDDDKQEAKYDENSKQEDAPFAVLTQQAYGQTYRQTNCRILALHVIYLLTYLLCVMLSGVQWKVGMLSI